MPRPTNVVGVQGRGSITGREVQTHQTPVGVLLQRGEDKPAADRFNGGLKLSCFELHLGEAVEDLTRAQVPVLALEAHPIVEGRGIAQREAVQELATREADRALESGKQGAMRLFWHGQRRVARRTRQRASFEEDMEVELDSGGEIQAEGVALDEEVRHRINASALAQQITQVEHSNAQGCPAMPRVRIWPELLGEVLAQMDAAFYCQVDEQREFLARGEQQRLIGMAHFWRTQYCQA